MMLNTPLPKGKFSLYRIVSHSLGLKKESFTSQICIPKQYSELYKTVSSHM